MANNNVMIQTRFDNTYSQFTPDVFKDDLFGELRVFIDTQGECWFIGKEVAERLGYQNTWEAINRHVRQELKQTCPIYILNQSLTPVNQGSQKNGRGGPQYVVLIHERGLYNLCMSSQLPEAIPFQKWVEEQIQDMRKYGVAMSQHLTDVIEFDPEQLWRIAQQKEAELNKANQIISELQDELDYYRVMISPSNLLTSTAIAKDFGISGKMLNKVLVKLNIIFLTKNGFEIVQSLDQFGFTKKENIILPDGKIVIQNCWTEYGRSFVYNVLTQNGFIIGGNNDIVAKNLLNR